jgi:hypothetical protein
MNVFVNPTELVAALGLAAAREPQALRQQLAAAMAELAAARAYQAQLQAKASQDEACRQEALDAAETWEDRAIGAEARASAAEYEVRRLGRVLAELQAQIAAMAQAAGQGGQR